MFLPWAPWELYVTRVTDKEAEARVRKVLSPVTQLLVQQGGTVWPRPPSSCPPSVCRKTLPKE